MRNIITIVQNQDIDEFKKKFEQEHPAVADGAWKPKEGALWTVCDDGRCSISNDQIELLKVAV